MPEPDPPQTKKRQPACNSTHPMGPVMLCSKENENSNSCCNGNLMLAPVNYALLLAPYTSSRFAASQPRPNQLITYSTLLRSLLALTATTPGSPPRLRRDLHAVDRNPVEWAARSGALRPQRQGERVLIRVLLLTTSQTVSTLATKNTPDSLVLTEASTPHSPQC